MNARAQRLCAWCGPLWIVVFFIGFWVIAGFIPPPSPADSAEQVAAAFRENTDSIRLGLLLTMYAGVLTVPWVAAISVQFKRMEGRFAPFTYAQLGLGVCLPFEFIVPIYCWEAAAFRPERSPEIIQTLNDLGWLPFTGLVFTIVVQAVVIGVAVLMDNPENPVFPRWFGYFSISAALCFVPAGFDVFFKDGPLAWNGLIAWWLLLVSFFLWTATLSVLLFSAIRSQQAGTRESEPANAVAHG
ncbi:hypothetical protein [Streptomyces sp. NPDC051572]|uniref:hypothetical protein n=1 Tax=unclassified Streptomyces TaxID=2593676 RepID=UPI00344B02A1